MQSTAAHTTIFFKKRRAVCRVASGFSGAPCFFVVEWRHMPMTVFELCSKSSDAGLQGLCSSKLPVWAHPDGCFARGGACIDREASGEDRDSAGPRFERQTLHGMVFARFFWSARLRACWNLGAFLEFKQGSFCCLSLSSCCGLVCTCPDLAQLRFVQRRNFFSFSLKA